MTSASAIFYAGDGRLADIVPPRERCVSSARRYDFPHLIRGEFCGRMGFATRTSTSAQCPVGVNLILGAAYELQILDTIISLVAVLVVHCHAVWSLAKKRLRHKQVHCERF